MSGMGDLPGMSGQYECEDDVVLGLLDVVLRTADAAGGEAAQRVRLHIQGRAVAETIAASGTDLAEPGRRVTLRFEYCSAWVPEGPALAQPSIPVTEQAVAAVTGTHSGAEGQFDFPAGGERGAPCVARPSEYADAAPALTTARLPLAIREEAAQRLQHPHCRTPAVARSSTTAPELPEYFPAGINGD